MNRNHLKLTSGESFNQSLEFPWASEKFFFSRSEFLHEKHSEFHVYNMNTAGRQGK